MVSSFQAAAHEWEQKFSPQLPPEITIDYEKHELTGRTQFT
jgi:hypothetical protein